jgi:hypothetical protein
VARNVEQVEGNAVMVEDVEENNFPNNQKSIGKQE